MNTKYRSLLTAIVLATALAHGYVAIAQDQSDPEVGFHGMLVVGSDRIYLSHLPMYVIPHRFQGIWEVTFGEEGDQKYRTHHQQKGQAEKQMYTLAPKELFALRALEDTKSSFRADVFVGHFEREGHEKLLTNVKVTIKNPVFWQELSSSHAPPQFVEYIVFGGATTNQKTDDINSDELYVAHRLTSPPNYDQILRIVTFPQGRTLNEGSILRIQGQEDWPGLGFGQRGIGIPRSITAGESNVPPVHLKVTSEYYIEEAELAVNNLPPE